MKWIKRILLALVVIIAMAVLGIYIYLQNLKPDYSATVKMPGLSKEVEVVYDNYGIPHIYASNEEDLFYAFGYVHAQDRLFQMEILRRLADGRLSEVFGEAAVKSDRYFRLLSFREHAKTTIAEVYKDPNAPFTANEEALTGLGMSKRELEVLQLMAEGLSNQEIAKQFPPTTGSEIVDP